MSCSKGHQWAFDASVAVGSGVVAVCGPPCAGKTTAVLSYVLQRRASTAVDGSCVVVYVTAKMTAPGELREAVVTELYSSAMKRRLSSLSQQSFGHSVTHYASHLPHGSELHIVLDDIDAKIVEDNGMLEWAAVCTQPTDVDVPRAKVVFWVISQMPLPLRTCRYHFVAKPHAETVKAWLGAVSASCRDAVTYYMTRNPTAMSIVSQDFRTLLVHVAMLTVPFLPPSPNALAYAAAWKHASQAASASLSAGAGTSSHASVVVTSLAQLGPSAQVLFTACFYCGAVSPGKDQQILFAGQDKTTRRAQQPRGPLGALSARTHAFSAARLERVYAKLAPLCINTSTAELLPSVVVLHHLPTFMSWGSVAYAANGREKFHSTMAEVCAVDVAVSLGLKLQDLVK